MDYEAIAQAFRHNGYGIVAAVFSPEELQEIDLELQRYLDEQLTTAEAGDVYYENADVGTQRVRCVFRMHERSDYFRQLMHDPRLAKIVQALFNDPQVVADGVMLIDKAPHTTYEFPFHQDNAYQFWNPPEAVAVTLALDDTTLETGAIVCLKRSHELEILPHKKSGVRGASLGLVDEPDLKQYPEAALTLRPGDVALHHVNVIHRTGPNHTDRHRRQLGFAYHSSRAVIDEEARDQYKRHLDQVNQELKP